MSGREAAGIEWENKLAPCPCAPPYLQMSGANRSKGKAPAKPARTNSGGGGGGRGGKNAAVAAGQAGEAEPSEAEWYGEVLSQQQRLGTLSMLLSTFLRCLGDEGVALISADDRHRQSELAEQNLLNSSNSIANYLEGAARLRNRLEQERTKTTEAAKVRF